MREPFFRIPNYARDATQSAKGGSALSLDSAEARPHHFDRRLWYAHIDAPGNFSGSDVKRRG